MPCTDWAEKLTAIHPDDLSPTDHQALKAHLAVCPACNQVYTAYRSLQKSFRTLSEAASIPAFSYQPLQRQRRASRARTPSPLFPLSLCLLLLTTLSSLYFRVSWSGPYQNIHAWILAVAASLPRRVNYLRSDSHLFYAIRSDSGYCLWRQKRYQRYEFVSSCPLRSSALTPIGSGVALAAALDFCRRAVQA